MIVCHCHGVTDKAIRSLIEEGAEPREIRQACAAGSGCGSCCPLIDEVAGRVSAGEHGRVVGRMAVVPATR